MNPGFIPYPSSANWKSLYRAAILETDRRLITQRLCDAEKAVLARGRELFHETAAPEEQEALEDALYALRAFRTALQSGEEAA